MNITITRDGQQYGPYTVDEVRGYLATGQLSYSDLAFREGGTQWLPLSTVLGVAPPRPALMPIQTKQRNVGMLILMAFAWTMVFWFVGLIVAGGVAGAMNPENPQAAGERVGEEYSGIIFLIALAISVCLTVIGMLPGTKK